MRENSLEIQMCLYLTEAVQYCMMAWRGKNIQISVIWIAFSLLKSATTFLKFIYSEKATKFCEISTVNLSYLVTVKSTVEISQNFVAFSEYMNFNKQEGHS